MMLVTNRDVTLNTTKGHSIAFKAGVPTHVPGIIYQDALGIGAVPATGDVPTMPADTAPVVVVEDRAGAIMEAIKKLVARNERGDFTAAGAPAVDAVFDLTGFRAQAKEINVVWQEYRDIAAGAEPVPRAKDPIEVTETEVTETEATETPAPKSTKAKVAK